MILHVRKCDNTVTSNGVKINPATIVEVWKDYTNVHYNDTIAAVTKAGYRAILAAPWYLNRITYGNEVQLTFCSVISKYIK